MKQALGDVFAYINKFHALKKITYFIQVKTPKAIQILSATLNF